MSQTSTNPRWSIRRILLRLAAAVVALFLIAVLLLDVLHVATLGLDLPVPRPVKQADLVTLPQDGSLPKDAGFHWDPAGRAWFHHADQGTTIMPYEWLIALEQPDFGILGNPGLLRPPGLFLDHDYISRFGFLPGADDPSLNPGGKLPLGWAIGRDFVDPTSSPDKPNAYNAKPYNAVGLTCAACHTGRLTYKQLDGKAVDILIEGGSAMIDVRKLQSALGRAVLYTLYVPLRFDRFADRVLGKDDTPEKHGRLREHVSGWMEEAAASQIASDKRHVNDLVSGFARTDALTLIGNRVFGPIDPGNVVAAGAPVNFPHIWDTAWFDWVQYNASIKMVDGAEHRRGARRRRADERHAGRPALPPVVRERRQPARDRGPARRAGAVPGPAGPALGRCREARRVPGARQCAGREGQGPIREEVPELSRPVRRRAEAGPRHRTPRSTRSSG